MVDFSTHREQMVDCQIRPNDVTDLDVIDAFLEVPRHEFVSNSLRSLAYSDADLPLPNTGSTRRFLMNVMPFSKMVQNAQLTKSDVVLVIGCGSGYGSAVISKLVNSVVAVEAEEDLANASSDTFSELGIDNVAVIVSEAASGYAKEAPYDAIVIEGSVEAVPPTLFDQLRDGGRLLTIVGSGLGAKLCRYLKNSDDISITVIDNIAAPQLPGFEVAKEFVF